MNRERGVELMIIVMTAPAMLETALLRAVLMKYMGGGFHPWDQLFAGSYQDRSFIDWVKEGIDGKFPDKKGSN